ncbi:methyltransferase domain-containing protein [Besnoitia besnoiti]|uniref:Methyltransferase domain-containing protein n=1 Tax=Besnoitia besnoiti TaxID=94643 RepID=A0A2A9MQC8_BESBE|nr:methyltransferase domain-containing protein [Besnoitia besnoiti]PFH38220.1 methyltransferase domain-containing protein [Besnoitia besnoiti]
MLSELRSRQGGLKNFFAAMSRRVTSVASSIPFQRDSGLAGGGLRMPLRVERPAQNSRALCLAAVSAASATTEKCSGTTRRRRVRSSSSLLRLRNPAGLSEEASGTSAGCWAGQGRREEPKTPPHLYPHAGPRVGAASSFLVSASLAALETCATTGFLPPLGRGCRPVSVFRGSAFSPPSFSASSLPRAFSTSSCRLRRRGSPEPGREVGVSRRQASPAPSPRESAESSFLSSLAAFSLRRRPPGMSEGGAAPAPAALEETRFPHERQAERRGPSWEKPGKPGRSLRPIGGLASVASASLLFAFAFRRWAEEQEEKRKTAWWKTSRPAAAESSAPPPSAPSASSPERPLPLPPRPPPVERLAPSLPPQLPCGDSAVRGLADTTTAESDAPERAPLSGESDRPSASSSSSKPPSPSAVAGLVSTVLSVACGAARRAQAEEEARRRRAIQEMIFGTPMRLEVAEGGGSLQVVVHDCRPLAAAEASLARDILAAAGAIGEGRPPDAGERRERSIEEDEEVREAMDLFRDTEKELWESAAFRKIVEAWRQELYCRTAVGDVLEIGVGQGKELHNAEWRQLCASYTGLDVRIEDEAKKAAAAVAAPPPYRGGLALPLIDLMEADAHDLPLSSDTFDSVLSHRVLCCVSSPATVLHSLLRVVRAGGRLLLFEHGALHPAVAAKLGVSPPKPEAPHSRPQPETARLVGRGEARKQEGRGRKSCRARRGRAQQRSEAEGEKKREPEEEEEGETRRGGRGQKRQEVDWEKVFPLPPAELAGVVSALEMPRGCRSGVDRRRGQDERGSVGGDASRKDLRTCAWIDVLEEVLRLRRERDTREERALAFPSARRLSRATAGDDEASRLSRGQVAIENEVGAPISGEESQHSDPARAAADWGVISSHASLVPFAADGKTPVVEEVHIFVAPRPEVERSWTCVRCVAVRS